MTVSNPCLPALREKAATLPLSPGVYLMRDREGTVIYVGKSRKLKNRVTSYFVGNDHSIKTARMVSRVADFDYILCDGEKEVLEPGVACYCPEGSSHTVINDGTEDLTFFAIVPEHGK